MKKIGNILFLYFFVFVMCMGGSFAWYVWQGANIDVNVTFSSIDKYINYETSIDMNGNEDGLTPSENHSSGVIENVDFTKKDIAKSLNLYGSMYLKIEECDSSTSTSCDNYDNLFRSSSLRWTLVSINNNVESEISTGNFVGEEVGNEIPMYVNFELDESITYKVYIWIDENSNANIDISGLSLNTSIISESKPNDGTDASKNNELYVREIQYGTGTINNLGLYSSMYEITGYKIINSETMPSASDTDWNGVTSNEATTEPGYLVNISLGYTIQSTNNICIKNSNGDVVCKVIGNYVNIAELPDATLCIADITYNGNVQQLVSSTSGIGYSLSGYTKTNAGTYPITATLDVGYEWANGTYDDITFECSIEPKSLTDSMVTLSKTDYEYDGTAKTPTVTVIDGSTTLTSDTDYTVTITNNTNIGTGTVTVTGIGNYAGTINKTFTISYKTYTVTLDDGEAITEGTTELYGRYGDGIYLDSSYSDEMSTSENAITIPIRTDYTFRGYYTEEDGGGTQLISETGYITSNFNATTYNTDVTIYAKWELNVYEILNSNTSLGYAPSLSEAVSKANEGNILKALIDNETGAVTIDESVTLDINGKTITATSPIQVDKNITATITDSAATAGTITSNGTSFISGDSNNGVIVNNGTLNIDRGTITYPAANSNYAIINNGTLNLSGTETNILCEVTAIQNNATMTMSNATVDSNTNVGISHYSGNLTVSSGTISGEYGIGSSTGIVTIEGGTITGGSGQAVRNNGAEVNISNGKFISLIENDVIINYSGTTTVSGGTYEFGEESGCSDTSKNCFVFYNSSGTFNINGGEVGIDIPTGDDNVPKVRWAVGIFGGIFNFGNDNTSPSISGTLGGITIAKGTLNFLNGTLSASLYGVRSWTGSNAEEHVINVYGGIINSTGNGNAITILGEGYDLDNPDSSKATLNIFGGELNAAVYNSIYVHSGIVNIFGGTLNGTTAGIYVNKTKGDAQINIDQLVEINQTDDEYGAIYEVDNSSTNEYQSEYNIKGGMINAKNYGLDLSTNSTTTISGGNITSETDNAILVNGGTVTIEDGTFTTNSGSTITDSDSTTTSEPTRAIRIESGTTTITGGKIVSTNGLEALYVTGDANVNITGGTFIGGNHRVIRQVESGTTTISGGTYLLKTTATDANDVTCLKSVNSNNETIIGDCYALSAVGGTINIIGTITGNLIDESESIIDENGYEYGAMKWLAYIGTDSDQSTTATVNYGVNGSEPDIQNFYSGFNIAAGELNFLNGTLKTSMTNIYSNSSAKNHAINISGGTISNTDGGFPVNLNVGTLTMTGGQITSKINTATNIRSGSATISAGTITSADSNSLKVISGTATVTGGYLESKSSGSDGTRSIRVEGTGVLNISGGEVITGGIQALVVKETGVANITGGTFTGGTGVSSIIYTDGGTINVNGGTYSSKYTCAEGTTYCGYVLYTNGGTINVYDEINIDSATLAHIKFLGGVESGTLNYGGTVTDENGDTTTYAPSITNLSTDNSTETYIYNGIHVASTGTLNFNKGTLSTAGTNIYSGSTVTTYSININDGNINTTKTESGYFAIDVSGGVTTVKGGSMSTVNSHTVVMRGGTFNMSGGTITSGYKALYILKSKGSVEVNVSGGTIIQNEANSENWEGAIFEANTATNDVTTDDEYIATYNISGGTFTAADICLVVHYGSSATVTGGTFNSTGALYTFWIGGTLTLGDNSNSVSTTSPVLYQSGTSYPIFRSYYSDSWYGTWEFYDGVLYSNYYSDSLSAYVNYNTAPINNPSGYGPVTLTQTGTYIVKTYLSSDITAPTITFGTNGGAAYVSGSASTATRSSKVTASDSSSGISAVYYYWSTSSTAPASSSTNWTSMTNGGTVSQSMSRSTAYYLHVKAVDKAGNETISSSKAFYANGWSGNYYYSSGSTLKSTVTSLYPSGGGLTKYYYHFNSSGVRSTGWVSYNDYWYYFNSSSNNGAAVTSSITLSTGSTIEGVESYTYYFNTTGTLKTAEWYSDKTNWYYYKTDGTKQVGSNTANVSSAVYLAWNGVNYWYSFDTSGKSFYVYTPSFPSYTGWTDLSDMVGDESADNTIYGSYWYALVYSNTACRSASGSTTTNAEGLVYVGANSSKSDYKLTYVSRVYGSSSSYGYYFRCKYYGPDRGDDYFFDNDSASPCPASIP